jgi:uncharacterized membrane protein
MIVEMARSRTRLLAGALAIAGILFGLYPIVRPFSDEISFQGAAAFASTAWVVAHMMAMAGFVLLTLGLLGLHRALQDTAVERLAFRALVVGLAGVGLTLPFYGVEAFGVHEIGQVALWSHDITLMKVAFSARTGLQLYVFLAGLLLIGASAIMVATAAWKSRLFPKWSGIPFAVGFALYIPQFFGTQAIRVAHGGLVTAGCLWIATTLWRQSARESSHPEA